MSRHRPVRSPDCAAPQDARDADALAEVETRDTGKLLREMRGQPVSIPEWFYYFAGLADKLQGATIAVGQPNFLVCTRREPAGVVAAIVHELAACNGVITGVFAATGQTCMAGPRHARLSSPSSSSLSAAAGSLSAAAGAGSAAPRAIAGSLVPWPVGRNALTAAARASRPMTTS